MRTVREGQWETYECSDHRETLPLQRTHTLKDIHGMFVFQLIQEHHAHAEDRAGWTAISEGQGDRLSFFERQMLLPAMNSDESIVVGGVLSFVDMSDEIEETVC